jgi:hypothetical protein
MCVCVGGGGDQGVQKLGSFIIHYFKITRFIAHCVKLTLHYTLRGFLHIAPHMALILLGQDLFVVGPHNRMPAITMLV